MSGDYIQLIDNGQKAIVFEQDEQVQPASKVIHFEFDGSGFGSLILDVPGFQGEDYQGKGYYPPQFESWLLTEKDENVLNGVPFSCINKRVYYRLESNYAALIKELKEFVQVQERIKEKRQNEAKT